MESTPHSTLPTFSILLIDDSAEDRYMIRRMLSRNQSPVSFDIREADNGAHGIALCRERLPDCILLDYRLNDTDGLSVLAALNEGRDAYNDPLCPVVILTGASSGAVTETAVYALKNGAQDYLVKDRLTATVVNLAMESAVEKVRLRRDLREAEARFRSSLENMIDCFGIYRAVRGLDQEIVIDFRCEYVNDAACRSSEMICEKQEGRLLTADLLSTHRVGRLLEEYVRVVQTGHPLETIDFVYGDAPSGSIGTYLLSALDIRAWKMGDGFAVAWRDVTAQKRIEDQLREAEERLTQERKRIEAERTASALKTAYVAEAVQRSLLLSPAPDAYPGVIVQSFYQSALDDALIGGDFFDVFAVSEEVVALVVGDATGKGVEAATYTAEVKFALRAYLREHRGDLAAALRLLNDFVIDNERLDAAHVSGACVALVVALVNTRNGETVCSCAGAEPPLILRAETKEIVAASVFGPLLGASKASRYTTTHNHMGIGDLIALTTDGITESRQPPRMGAGGGMRSGEFFGIEGLATALTEESADADRGLAEVEEAIVARALAWANGRQHDDICLLIAKRREV
jgi:serine phosphatase RsbU (regulator of sigma subunit)/ActR/RegA family two-component response regulator